MVLLFRHTAGIVPLSPMSLDPECFCVRESKRISLFPCQNSQTDLHTVY
jgi:hypothetical protein